MRLGINLPDELVAQIDERAKSLYISRSAYIATALSQKLQSDKMLDMGHITEEEYCAWDNRFSE